MNIQKDCSVEKLRPGTMSVNKDVSPTDEVSSECARLSADELTVGFAFRGKFNGTLASVLALKRNSWNDPCCISPRRRATDRIQDLIIGAFTKLGFQSNSKLGRGVWQLYGENRCRNLPGPVARR